MCEEFDNLWTNTAINEYLKETRNEILSKKEEITRTIYKKFKKKFCRRKKGFRNFGKDTCYEKSLDEIPTGESVVKFSASSKAL